MPHLVTHRPRVSSLTSADADSELHKLWETINAFSYKAGGLYFVFGSFFFFPMLKPWEAMGAWLFTLGSLFYLMVTSHDLLEVVSYWAGHHTETRADRIEYVAASAYVLGSLLFTVGSLCFVPAIDAVTVGAWCFIIGSLVFIVGGGVNILQVVEAPSLLYMQLFTITLAMFLVGSALFTVASVPYLMDLVGPAKTEVTAFAAAQFVAGSVLFFLGGLAIYYRKLVRDKLESFCHANGLGTMFIRELQTEIHDRGATRRTRT